LPAGASATFQSGSFTVNPDGSGISVTGGQASGTISMTITTTGATVAGTTNGITVTTTFNTAVSGGTSLVVDQAPLTIAGSEGTTKCFGDTYTPDGSEFVVSGTLYNGNEVTSVTVNSAGYDAEAAVDYYDVIVSNPVGTGLSNYNISFGAGYVEVITCLNPGNKLIAEDCGITIASVDQVLTYEAVMDATQFEIRVEGPNAYSQSQVRLTNAPKNTMRMNWFSGLEYGETYQVSLRYYDGVEWSAYGDPCDITMPVSTRLIAAHCGMTVESNDFQLTASRVPGAVAYKVLVEGPNGYTREVVRGTSRVLQLSTLTGIKPGTTYSVSWAHDLGMGYSDFGAACDVTSESTKLIKTDCGRTLGSLDDILTYDYVTGADLYEINVTAEGYNRNYQRLANKFTMKNVGKTTPGVTYSVRVRYSKDGGMTWSAYGPACNVTTPAMMGMKTQDGTNNQLEVSLEVYPNPSNGAFTVSASEAGTVNIINELGQLIQSVEVNKENNFKTTVEGLNRGIYFVTTTSNGSVLTEKVIVQ
jgi:hypothetical protein